jgi:16S rRNA (cytosine1402-N4)-methyltransferase
MMYHEPVLAREVVERLVTSPGGLYLDGTLGGGGHSRAILERLDENGRLLALDWDEDAHANQEGDRAVLGRDSRVSLLRMGFGELDRLPAPWDACRFQGVLLDLGLSSHQVDTPERGFAYLHDGPLDMRMDRRRERSAADLLAELDERELADLLFRFGELSEARRLARLLVLARAEAPLDSTGRLRQVIEARLGTRGSFALLSRIFQALRIAVNDEMGQLERGLDGAFERLTPGGRLAVITYHSLEDRQVKSRFRQWAGEDEKPRSRHLPARELPVRARLLERRGLVPTTDECERNPRSRSARLRVLERTEV